MSKQRSKYQKVINIELLEGQKSKIENALHEKKGVTLLTRFTKESTRPMLLTKRQINQIQRSVAVDPNKAINITMSADQLHQNRIYKGGFIFSLILAAVTAAVTSAVSVGVEKAISGAGIPSPAVSRQLLKRKNADLIIRKNNRNYKVLKLGKENVPPGYKPPNLLAYLFNPKGNWKKSVDIRYPSTWGRGFYLRPHRGGAMIPIHPKTNSDIRRLNNLIFEEPVGKGQLLRHYLKERECTADRSDFPSKNICRQLTNRGDSNLIVKKNNCAYKVTKSSGKGFYLSPYRDRNVLKGHGFFLRPYQGIGHVQIDPRATKDTRTLNDLIF